jgi:outer membrane receptor protein involved in Fe transport
VHLFNRYLPVSGIVTLIAAAIPAAQVAAESHVVSKPGRDEIIVSVRKEDESLQDVPLSVDVFDSDSIQRKGINSLNDITRLSPSLILDGGFAPQDTRVVIRGLNPTRGRQNVAFLQDGIDISSEAITTAGGSLLTNPRLFDIERIEVVKGPQSALYGRSAFAGGINYVTKRPSDELEGGVRVELTDQNAWQTSASVSGPVIKDMLNLGATISSWDEDGYYRNTVTGNKIGNTEGAGISATALFTPTDAIEFFARLEYSDDEFGPQAQATQIATETLPIPSEATGTILNTNLTEIPVPQGIAPDSDDLVVSLSRNPRTGLEYPGTDREIKRFSLIGEFDVGFGELTWFSHVANVETKQYQDGKRIGDIFDPNPPGFQVVTNSAELNLNQDTDLLSQELRFSRETDGPVDWAVGALYWREEAELRDGSNACFTFVFPASPAGCDFYVGELGTTVPLNRRFWDRDTKHWSVYADIDWEISEQWLLGFEVRYSEEDLDVIGPDSQITIDPGGALGGSTTGPANDVLGQRKDDFWAPKATLQYMPSDDLMFYGSIAKGVKPAGISTVVGGIAPFVPEQFSFDQEKVWVYEVGGKSTLADGALILNGALFYQDFTDKQLNTQVDLAPGVVGVVPVNAGEAEVWGVELDATWFVTERLSLIGSYTWLDGEYKKFITESTGGSSLAQAGNCTLVLDSMGDDICQLDLSGRELEGLPEHALVATASYRFPISADMDILAEATGQYQSERYQSEFNTLEFDAYWQADFRLGVEGDNWEVIGFLDNAFDDRTTRSGFTVPNLAQFNIDFTPPLTVSLPSQATYNLTRPRTAGVRASWRF